LDDEIEEKVNDDVDKVGEWSLSSSLPTSESSSSLGVFCSAKDQEDQ
jgi:hypothetical protein